MKKNFTLIMRGIPEDYYELYLQLFKSFVQCSDPCSFSFATVNEDSVDGIVSHCVVVGTSELFDDEEDFYE